jgi:hypothetical protein
MVCEKCPDSHADPAHCQRCYYQHPEPVNDPFYQGTVKSLMYFCASILVLVSCLFHATHKSPSNTCASHISSASGSPFEPTPRTSGKSRVRRRRFPSQTESHCTTAPLSKVAPQALLLVRLQVLCGARQATSRMQARSLPARRHLRHACTSKPPTQFTATTRTRRTLCHLHRTSRVACPMLTCLWAKCQRRTRPSSKRLTTP